MNFLAHIYLSGNDELIKIGNFMADGIRGNHLETWPEAVIKGVRLHRAIDTYTDAHPVFRQSTKRLHARYHHYAGVIVDLIYDHFLAKNWLEYSSEPLEAYVQQFYDSLEAHREILTEKTLGLMPYMLQYNWLVSYRTLEGIGRILHQMDHRTQQRSGMRHAVEELQAHYAEFEHEFTTFFIDLRAHVAQKTAEL
ncbi:acyl carrier protein phosphodiesterase [Flavobacterium sp. CYK-55]|uniref:acyl carrier protein phosphodiesterase n=1 Tax=Flavobacterium sp. CYK-55 TaxID=2835529 RepID=UPI001BD0B58D|nr:acyl carrier protein phosphodiesterase [Flavobacterium sp. CYK-55]MBS7788038.1 acyl carrier protein phosphodiesterase [Flavobacterium sp. CYK-55]